MIKRAAAFLILGLFMPGVLGAVQTPIYSVFTDAGSVGDDIYTWGNVTLDSSTTNPPAPEGIYSMGTNVFSGFNAQLGYVAQYGGWGIVYLQQDHSTPRSVDLSAYASSGEIRFWANCSTDNFDIEIEHLDTSKEDWSFSGAFPAGTLNTWQPIVIPLNQVQYPISDISSPFLITLNAPGTCYIDNIRYALPTVPDAEIVNTAVKNISDQSVATSMTWSVASLPAGWVRSNQYIELDVDSETLGWGVQIYTDNTSANANPTFTRPAGVNVGSPGSNPAGLVDTSKTYLRIPIAWSVKGGTETPTALAPTAADPNNTADANSFQWFVMKDKTTPIISQENTTAFVNGDPTLYSTVSTNQGIHYGYASNGSPLLGAEGAPNYVYLEANFGVAATPRTYKTNTLTLEYFYQ